MQIFNNIACAMQIYNNITIQEYRLQHAISLYNNITCNMQHDLQTHFSRACKQEYYVQLYFKVFT